MEQGGARGGGRREGMVARRERGVAEASSTRSKDRSGGKDTNFTPRTMIRAGGGERGRGGGKRFTPADTGGGVSH